LDLRNNNVTTAGVVAFTNTIKAWGKSTSTTLYTIVHPFYSQLTFLGGDAHSMFVANSTLHTVMLSGNPVFELAETRKRRKEDKISTAPASIESTSPVLDSPATDASVVSGDDNESLSSADSTTSLGSLPPLPQRKSAVFSGVRAATRAARLAAQANIQDASNSLKEIFHVLSTQAREERVEQASVKHEQMKVS
jgi:hypothetical protein